MKKKIKIECSNNKWLQLLTLLNIMHFNSNFFGFLTKWNTFSAKLYCILKCIECQSCKMATKVLKSTK